MHPLTKAILILLGALAAWAIWVLLAAAHRGQLRHLYRHHMAETRRERHFLGALAFFITFATVRYITHSIHAGTSVFHDNVTGSGLHIHHLVYGIVGLLLVGYLWLSEVGTGARTSSIWLGRITCLLFGIAAALTLDEFALWLHLADVYWSPQGRASVRAALFFGSLLSVGFWGAPFLHALTRFALGIEPKAENGSPPKHHQTTIAAPRR